MTKLQNNTYILNSPLEIGLRAIVILTAAYPVSYSLQRLLIFDYLSVHSDDIPNGPPGLHPKTPHRSGELLVKREALQKALNMYMRYGLLEQRFETNGITFIATEKTGSFLDTLEAQYIATMRERVYWLVKTFQSSNDYELNTMIQQKLDVWGAEFETESTLWLENEI